MKINVLTKSGEKKDSIKIDDKVLAAKKSGLIAEYINYIRVAKRNSIASTLDRGQASGGGKKPWRQKGTGRARVGSSRSPLWIGGGVTFGPNNQRKFWLNLPQKTRSYGRMAILNIFAAEDKISIVEDITSKIEKTKEADQLLKNLNFEGKITLILSDNELENNKAFRNLPYLNLMSKTHQRISEMASSDQIIFSSDGYKAYFE